jgi:hypothetical protein
MKDTGGVRTVAFINENYLKLKESYLFSEIAKKVDAFKAANPDKKVVRLGIGDVTLPRVQPGSGLRLFAGGRRAR